jgi:hypothetical protein
VRKLDRANLGSFARDVVNIAQQNEAYGIVVRLLCWGSRGWRFAGGLKVSGDLIVLACIACATDDWSVLVSV